MARNSSVPPDSWGGVGAAGKEVSYWGKDVEGGREIEEAKTETGCRQPLVADKGLGKKTIAKVGLRKRGEEGLEEGKG